MQCHKIVFSHLVSRSAREKISSIIFARCLFVCVRSEILFPNCYTVCGDRLSGRLCVCSCSGYHFLFFLLSFCCMHISLPHRHRIVALIYVLLRSTNCGTRRHVNSSRHVSLSHTRTAPLENAFEANFPSHSIDPYLVMTSKCATLQ